MKRVPEKAGILVFWLLVWHLAARLVQNDVLLVGPIETITALRTLLFTAAFRRAVLFSFLRIFGGFFAGALSGFLLALLSFALPFSERLLSPFVAALKTVPVACYAILLLIWSGRDGIAFWISAIVVCPVLYVNTMQGLRAADKELLEIASMFTMTRGDSWRHIYLPALLPFLHSAFQVAVGMSWKSGIAAEVIGLKTGTLGNELNRAKILLKTDNLFAVTLTVILLSWGTEKLLLRLLSRMREEG